MILILAQYYALLPIFPHVYQIDGYHLVKITLHHWYSTCKQSCCNMSLTCTSLTCIYHGAVEGTCCCTWSCWHLPNTFLYGIAPWVIQSLPGNFCSYWFSLFKNWSAVVSKMSCLLQIELKTQALAVATLQYLLCPYVLSTAL